MHLNPKTKIKPTCSGLRKLDVKPEKKNNEVLKVTFRKPAFSIHRNILFQGLQSEGCLGVIVGTQTRKNRFLHKHKVIK